MENKCKYEMFKADEEKAKRNSNKDKKHEFRSKFERDRDRILYSKAFRRLSGKTQVFVTGHEDHIRTRLTHTLEVSQIATTIASYFGLDIALTEAISLGHDIGHTPFGHEGERILNSIMNGCEGIKEFNKNMPNEKKGFKHNWQSLRVLTQLEKKNEDYDGLNLTNYTLWGILNHSKLEWEECENKLKVNFYRKNSNGFINKIINNENNKSWTFEGLIVRQADEIAQRHHDSEDGIIANLIDKKELIEKFKEYFSETKLYKEGKEYRNMVEKLDKNIKTEYYLPILSRLIVDFLAMNLINNTEENFGRFISEYNIQDNKDFYNNKLEIYNKEKDIFSIVDYNKNFSKQEKKFKEYLKNRILSSFKAQSMDGKANYIIKKLFKAFISNPQQLPDKTIISFYRNYNENYLDRVIDRDKEMGLYFSPALVGDLREKLKEDHFKNCNDSRYKCALLRTICDYVSGMTDNYALNQYELLYGAKQRELREYNL
jgi:dGTPase